VPAPSGPTTKLAAKLQAINIISNAVTLVKPDGSELVLTVGLSTKLTVNGNTVSIGAFLPRFGNTVNVEYATGNNILVSMAAQD
jgi:hypothetical protein